MNRRLSIALRVASLVASLTAWTFIALLIFKNDAPATPKPVTTTVYRIPSPCQIAARRSASDLFWLHRETAAWSVGDRRAAFNAAAHISALGSSPVLSACEGSSK